RVTMCSSNSSTRSTVSSTLTAAVSTRPPARPAGRTDFCGNQTGRDGCRAVAVLETKGTTAGVRSDARACLYLLRPRKPDDDGRLLRVPDLPKSSRHKNLPRSTARKKPRELLLMTYPAASVAKASVFARLAMAALALTLGPDAGQAQQTAPPGT